MQTLIQNEVDKGRFLGPFQEKPFTNTRINPIGFVPKKTPNSYRLISDLSQPKTNSVNDSSPPSASRVSYPSIQDAIDCILSLVNDGHTPMLSKLDVKSAFRLMPLTSSQFPPMGVQFSGNYYIDAFLPMGASSSCRGDGGGRPSSVMSLGVTSVGGHSHGHPASPIGVGSLWEDIDPRSPEPLVVRGGWLWLIWVVRWTT